MRFRDQVVVVTGAAVGIGRDHGRPVRSRKGAGGRPRHRRRAAGRGRAWHRGRRRRGAGPALRCRTSPADVGRAVDTVVGRWGRIDVLVNNAGGFYKIASIEEIDHDEWETILRLNLTSVFICTKAVVPIMKRQGHGRIVNMASIAGRTGNIPTAAHYAAAKAGIIGFTRQLARERGLCTVSSSTRWRRALRPPHEFYAARSPEATRALAAEMPIRRLGEPSRHRRGGALPGLGRSTLRDGRHPRRQRGPEAML